MEEKKKSVGEELKESLVSAVIESLDRLCLESILERGFGPFLNEKKILKINNVFIPKVKNVIKEELGEILDRVELPEKLDKLEQMKEDSKGRCDSWKPNQNVDDFCRTRRVQTMMKKKAELDFLLKKKLHNIDQLKEKVEKALTTVPLRHEQLEKKKKVIIDQLNDNARNMQNLLTQTGDNAPRITYINEYDDEDF